MELMRDAIIYNRNNPSVVFYEGGNEAISETHMQELKDLRDKYDPHGGRYVGSREMLDSEVAEYGGEMLYINKSSDQPMWATEYSRDEGLRKYWDDFSPPCHKDGDGPLYRNAPAREYNRNQDSHAIEDVIRWFNTKYIEPLFPFGHGLSYTTFTYSGLKLLEGEDAKGPWLTVEFELANTGQREGAEAAQVYAQDVQSNLPRPVEGAEGFCEGLAQTRPEEEGLRTAGSQRVCLLRSGQEGLARRGRRLQDFGRQLFSPHSFGRHVQTRQYNGREITNTQ